MVRRSAVMAVLAGLSTGCQPQPQPTEPNVHIRTPRVKVDVQGKEKGDTEVDVNRKDH